MIQIMKRYETLKNGSNDEQRKWKSKLSWTNKYLNKKYLSKTINII